MCLFLQPSISYKISNSISIVSNSVPNIGNTVYLDGEEDEDLEFGEAVLLPVAEWAATKSSYLDYEFLFFIAVEVL